MYNVIPSKIKPPADLALLKFPDGFDMDMSYQLRERKLETLEQMKNIAVSVEANLLAKRERMRNEKRVTIKEETSTSYSKIYSLAKAMEKMMDRLESMERKPQWDNQQQGPQIRNPNFRKNTNTGKSRESAPDQQIRPPFQENYDESSHQNEDDEDTQINLVGINDDNTIFLTQ